MNGSNRIVSNPAGGLDDDALARVVGGKRSVEFGDPIGNYNFRVEIDGIDAGQFTGVDGLQIEQE